MFIRRVFYVFLALFSLTAQSVEVSKTVWVEAMQSALPAAFCAPDQYFRQCFKVSAKECEATAASTTRACLKNNQNKIPALLKQPSDGQHWGTIIGQCAGAAYEVSLLKKHIDSEKCRDPKHWI